MTQLDMQSLVIPRIFSLPDDFCRFAEFRARKKIFHARRILRFAYSCLCHRFAWANDENAHTSRNRGPSTVDCFCYFTNKAEFSPLSAGNIKYYIFNALVLSPVPSKRDSVLDTEELCTDTLDFSAPRSFYLTSKFLKFIINGSLFVEK